MRFITLLLSARFAAAMIAASFVASLMMLWWARIPGNPWPGGENLWVVGGYLTWAGVAVCWLFRLIAQAAGILGARAIGPLKVKSLIASSIPPLLLVATWTMIAWDLPFHIAFAVSRPAMERAATSMSSGNEVRGRQWIGVFPIRSVIVLAHDGISLQIDMEDMCRGRRGFYYFADPVHARGDTTNERVFRLDDHWYFWQRSIW